MRELILARIEALGYPITRPNSSVMMKWRKPKDPMERMTRQMIWLQGSLDSGKIPLGYSIDALDDETLVLLFERSVRDNYRNGAANAAPVLTKPVPKPAYVIPGGHDGFTAMVEFELYDSVKNQYGLPDMGKVTEWLTNNSHDFEVRGTFVLFKAESEASLCYLRFI